jgi:hypothetical protein
MRYTLILISTLYLAPVWGVRPFVTDDARITDVRQLEFETWTEFSRGSETTLGQHVMGGFTFNEWLQVIAGVGVGQELDGELTISNPVIQPKILLWQAYDDGFPGLALGLGTTLPYGRGAYFDDALGYYAIAMITTRQFNDWLQLHLNFGRKFSQEKGQSTEGRNYWGVGLDVGVMHMDYRLIAEAYAGDPFESFAPDIAFQSGLRWLKSEYINFDVTFGTQPELQSNRRRSGHWEYWGQVGVRLLFDTFRDQLGPGLYEGARGAINPRSAFPNKPRPQFPAQTN